MKHDWQGQLYIDGKPTGKVISMDVESKAPFELKTEVSLDGKTWHSAEFNYHGCYINEEFIKTLCKKKPSKLSFIKKQMKRFFEPLLTMGYMLLFTYFISIEPSTIWRLGHIFVFALCLVSFIQSIQRRIK